jgi:predicted NodU family carbamoyl transferase
VSLGLGLLYFYDKLKDKLNFSLNHAFYGGNYSSSLNDFLSNHEHLIKLVDEYSPETFAQDIENFPVCWFEKASEIGPRALGGRSILSSATTLSSKNALNKIKKREFWRPVAPIILLEEFSKWFLDIEESPFMLRTFEVAPEMAEKIPAVLHYNHSARVQTINSSHSLHKILSDYFKITGIPILCNTSLNDKNEPIIENYDELLRFSLKKKIPVIYVEGKRIELKLSLDYEKGLETSRWASVYFTLNDSTKFDYSHIDPEIIDFYVNHRYIFKDLDDNLTDKSIEIISKKYTEMLLLHENLPS